jgi:hypothetical protein
MEKTKKFKLYLTLLISAFAVGYGSIIVVLFLPLTVEFRLAYAIVMIVLVFLVSILLRPKIYILSIASHYEKMKENQNEVFQSAYEIPSAEWESNLIKFGYHPFADFANLTSYYQISNDEGNILKRGVLEIIHFIKDENMGFHDDKMTQMVHDIEDKLMQNNKKYLHYLIINVKVTNKLSEKMKDKADEVAYEKHRNRHVSIINVYVLKPTHQIYFLHNDNYYPSIVYQKGVERIKSIF